MVQFAPYLNFRGTTRTATTFYQSVFGGELTLNSASDLGLPADSHGNDRVMHAELTTQAGLILMAGGIHADDTDTIDAGNVCTIMISGELSEVAAVWEQLIDGGQVTVPFSKAPWGDTFGSCTDRFGVPWLLNVNARSAAAP